MVAVATLAPPDRVDATVLALITPTPAEINQARRRLHLKTLVIAAIAVVGYRGLVFGGANLPLRLLYAGLFVLAVITTATSIMHDGNHSSYSSSRLVNRAAAFSADLLGASSWIWRFKHNNLHHGNTNVVGMDADIDQAPFARLAAAQPWRRWHRYQHVYLWFLYGFLAIRWFIMTDFRDLVRGGIGPHKFPRKPRKRDLVTMALGKVMHATWAIGIPLLYHRWWVVLAFYLACSWVVGFALAVMFQLAHCVEGAEFASPETPRRGPDFAAHQLATTVDVRCRTRVGGAALHWVMGGLDCQIEHHLAPRLPHSIYPKVARRLRAVSRTHGFALRAHTTPWRAIVSHARWLRAMGRPPLAA